MREPPYQRTVTLPLTAARLKPPGPECEIVQFSQVLSEKDHKKLAKFLSKYPHLDLRVYGDFNKDLDFLRYYPDVRQLSVDLFHLKNFDGLEHLSPDLESLRVGMVIKGRHSLSFLARFPKLKRLSVHGHDKDIEVVSSLSELEQLMLRSITLPDLSLLKPLKKLHSLDIKLGGTTNLELLPKIGRLRYLELWQIRGLTDLGPISSVRTLQYLFLQSLKNVTQLPSLMRLKKLRHWGLQTMKGLTDLQPAAKAPALEELVIIEMPHLKPNVFRPFLKSRTLKRVSVSFGSDRQKREVTELLGLPEVDGEFVFE